MASIAVLLALRRSLAFAGEHPSSLDQWAHGLLDIGDQVSKGQMTMIEWQERVAILNQSVPTADLVKYLDLKKLTGGFTYFNRLARTADVRMPEHVTPLMPLSERNWFVRVFAMRRGGVILPHIHNNMVSCHLVISGSFHVRTHDRIKDLDDAVVLRPTMDHLIKAGDVITMSDQRNNQHWFVAEDDQSQTFDAGVIGLNASWPYGLKADQNTIFVDVDRTEERDGTIVAPRMTFLDCAEKYAADA